MKKSLFWSILMIFGLSFCTPAAQTTLPSTATQITLPALLEIFPKIDKYPRVTSYTMPTINKVPDYNSESREMWQVDLRSTDLRDLDLSNSLDDLMFATFDSKTTWPSSEKMMAGFDPQQIMELGKDPGLGIQQLHSEGIDGRGVGIAIIDQVLLVNHSEYVNQLRLYEEADDIAYKNYEASMHGAAVASIAVGKTVGVAPGADLYFIGTMMCSQGSYETNDFSCLAESVRRILEINEILPEGRKIRVLSISVGWSPDSIGYEEITAATRDAKEAGLLVICSSIEIVHGLKFNTLGRHPLSDPNLFSSYEPGLFWADQYYTGFDNSGRLLVPMDSRTTASPTGVDDYVFYREGGWSWSIPYIAGVYALAAQVKPSITPEEFWSTAMETGQTIELNHDGKTYSFGPILDPQALIKALKDDV